jgi:glycosyltransferase involved in cell wall biosynthesis
MAYAACGGHVSSEGECPGKRRAGMGHPVLFVTNFISAVAATNVWFNSQYNRDDFLSGLTPFLKRMPDYQPVDLVDEIRSKSFVRHPGIDTIETRTNRREGPARILWAARWEHDKNPELFFDAIRELARLNVDFRLSVIGERFKDSPEVFEAAAKEFGERINVWGYQESREDYLNVLAHADIFVSTADHEFFGLGAVEAIAAGAYPLLPNRLAYPELLANGGMSDEAIKTDNIPKFFYDGSAKKLAKALAGLIYRLNMGDLWFDDPAAARKQVERFFWPELVEKYDDELERLAN